MFSRIKTRKEYPYFLTQLDIPFSRKIEKLHSPFTPSFRGTKRLVSVNICSVEGNSADIFVSKVSPGIFVIKVK